MRIKGIVREKWGSAGYRLGRPGIIMKKRGGLTRGTLKTCGGNAQGGRGLP